MKIVEPNLNVLLLNIMLNNNKKLVHPFLTECCITGALRTLQQLCYLIDDDDDFIDMFDCATVQKQYDVAKWLVSNYKFSTYEIQDLIVTCCRHGDLDLFKYILSVTNYNYNNMYKIVFRECCCSNNFDILMYVFKEKEDVDLDDVVSNTCWNGHLDMVKWLFKTFDVNKTVVNSAFQSSCASNSLHICKWLVKKFPSDIDVHEKSEEAFRSCCENLHLDVAKWLIETFPTINMYAKDHDKYAPQITVFESVANNSAYNYQQKIKMLQWLASVNEYFVIKEDGKHFYDEERHCLDRGVSLYFKNLGRHILKKHIYKIKVKPVHIYYIDMYPNNFNSNNHEFTSNYEEVLAKSQTHLWVHKFHKQYHTLIIHKKDLQTSLDNILTKYQEQTDNIFKDDKQYFVRTEHVSLKYCKHGVGPYTDFRSVVESLLSCDEPRHAPVRDDDGLDTVTMYFLPWLNQTKTDLDMEFRLFVHNRRVVGISQQRWHTVNEKLRDVNKPDIINIVRKIVGYFNTVINKKITHVNSYTVDLMMLKDESVYFIEINSFGKQYAAGSGLFHWLTDEQILYSDGSTVEFRYVVDC